MVLVCLAIWQDHLIQESCDANLGRHRYRDSGDKMFLFLYIILQDLVIKSYSNIMSKSPLRLVTILPSLVAIDTV